VQVGRGALLGERSLLFHLQHFLLHSFVYVDAFLDDACELEHFVHGLPIALLLLLHYF